MTDLRSEQAKTTRNVAGLLVVPGLIDFHSHVYWGGTSLGVDAEVIARRSGTTTFLDAGSAGPGNFLGFKHHVTERSAVRILSYLKTYPAYAWSCVVVTTIFLGDQGPS